MLQALTEDKNLSWIFFFRILLEFLAPQKEEQMISQIFSFPPSFTKDGLNKRVCGTYILLALHVHTHNRHWGADDLMMGRWLSSLYVSIYHRKNRWTLVCTHGRPMKKRAGVPIS